MNNFDVLDGWAEFSEYDLNQTLFTICTINEYTKQGNRLLANKNINDGGYIL